MLVVLTLVLSVAYGGDFDLFRMLATSSTGISTSLNIFYLLVLGKLYIIPASLVLILLYSSFKLDVLMIVTLLFTIHFTVMLVSVIGDVASPSIGMFVTGLTLVSLVLTTILFLDASDVSVFLGLSYSSVLHMSVLLATLPGSRIDELIGVLLLAYVLLSVVIFVSLHTLQTSVLNFEALSGMANANVVVSSVFILVLFMFLGIPPSVVFVLKTSMLSLS